MLRRAEAAAQVMEHICNHDAHGYSQPKRAGDGTTETITLSSGEKVLIHGGDYDCSELVRMCYAAAGVLEWGYWASYMYTGNEHEVLTSHGFREIAVQAAEDMERGDVLWMPGHTEMYLGNGKRGGARGSYEWDGISGRQGDQSGREVRIDTYVPSIWTKAYRYFGPEKNDQQPGEPVNNAGLYYRSHVRNLGWLPAVHDGQTSGTTGQSLRLEAIKIAPPKGLELDVTVHCQNLGDVTYKGVKAGENSGEGSNANDPIMGTTGRGLRLEGFSIEVVKNTTGKKLLYRAHVQNEGWQEWKSEGEFAGTRGKRRRMEAIQLKLV